jgi:hypothetical protein
MTFVKATQQGQSVIYFDRDGRKTVYSGRIPFRNNNPGNVKRGPFADRNGAIGYDNRNFAIFPDIKSGRAAQKDLLTNGYRGLTFADAIAKYKHGEVLAELPPEKQELTEQYLKELDAWGTGVPRDEKFETLTPAQREALIFNIQRQEGAINKRGYLMRHPGDLIDGRAPPADTDPLTPPPPKPRADAAGDGGHQLSAIEERDMALAKLREQGHATVQEIEDIFARFETRRAIEIDDADEPTGLTGGTVHVDAYVQDRGGHTVHVGAYDRSPPPHR